MAYKWHNLFLTVLKIASPGSGWQLDRVLVKALFGLQNASQCHCILTWQEESPLASFIRKLILLMRAPPFWPNYLPKDHLLITSHWGVGFSYKFWRYTDIQSITLSVQQKVNSLKVWNYILVQYFALSDLPRNISYCVSHSQSTFIYITSFYITRFKLFSFLI